MGASDKEALLAVVRNHLENPLSAEFSTGKLRRWRQALSRVRWETYRDEGRRFEYHSLELEHVEGALATVSLAAQAVGTITTVDGTSRPYRRQVAGSVQLVREPSGWKVLNLPADFGSTVRCYVYDLGSGFRSPSTRYLVTQAICVGHRWAVVGT